MAADKSIIADSHELGYISHVIDRVLTSSLELNSIQDFQAAVAKNSIQLGREVRTNLVFDRDRIAGINFSFADDPARKTPTVSFATRNRESEQELAAKLVQIDKPNCSPVDASSSEKGNQSLVGQSFINSTGTNALTNTSKAKDLVPSSSGSLATPSDRSANNLQRSPTGSSDVTNLESARLPASGIKVNPNLAREAERLAGRDRLDSLWLSGVVLKSATNFVEAFEHSHASQKNAPIDKQAAGNALVNRFEQVLPERFAALRAGDSPKPFNWRDPSNNNLYRFEFESGAADGSSPHRLRGIAIDGSSKVPAFCALSPDGRRWAIEQCDFSQQQLRCLSQAQRPTKALSAGSTPIAKVGGLEH